MGLCWVDQESGKPVVHLWLSAPPRYCLPSLRRLVDLIAYCNLALFKMNSLFNQTCVGNGSLNEYVYVCIIPSTTIVNDCWYHIRHHYRQWLLGVQHSSRQWRTRAPHRWALCLFHGFIHGCSHKYNWGHVEACQIHLRPYWENEVKHVINILKCSPPAGFNDAPELIVKIMLSVYLYSFGPYITVIFSGWIFSCYPKNS